MLSGEDQLGQRSAIYSLTCPFYTYTVVAQVLQGTISVCFRTFPPVPWDRSHMYWGPVHVLGTTKFARKKDYSW